MDVFLVHAPCRQRVAGLRLSRLAILLAACGVLQKSLTVREPSFSGVPKMIWKGVRYSSHGKAGNNYPGSLHGARGHQASRTPSRSGSFLAGGMLALFSLCLRSKQSLQGAHGTSRPAGGLRRVVGRALSRPILTLGTRGSPLAVAQANEAKRRLGEAFPELASDDAVGIRVISTTGDQRLDIALSELGGKGLFTKELDAALISKEVDFCVHSTKDVPTALVPGTELCTMLPREDTRDVLISADPKITQIEDFPSGSIIGTASLRRQSQIYAVNPYVKCVNFRGNVQTRLRKLNRGEVSATLLAFAGLKRMHMEQHATSVLEWEEMLPAISQGAISFQCRSDDEKVLSYLKPLNHQPTMEAVMCERAFLVTLDGNCKTPIAGQARVFDGQLHFLGLVASPDGQKIFRVERKGPVSDCEDLGRDAGYQVRAEAGEQFFADMQAYVQDIQAANTKPVR